jgi:hypothetical protein
MIRTISVLAFHPNEIGPSDAHVSKWVDAGAFEIDVELEDNPANVSFRPVGKFVVQSAEIEGITTYLARLDSKPIGILQLHRNSDGLWASETLGVLSSQQGQGLGLVFYETALADLGKLASSASLSRGSSKLWKFLVTKHRGVFVIQGEYSSTGRPLEVKIKDWVLEQGMTYPVFTKADGTPIQLDNLLRSTNAREKAAAYNGYYLIKAFGGSSKPLEHWPF